MTARPHAYLLGCCLLALAACMPPVGSSNPGTSTSLTTKTSTITCLVKLPLDTSAIAFGINGPPRGINGATGINSPPRGLTSPMLFGPAMGSFGVAAVEPADLGQFKINFLRNDQLIKTTWSVTGKDTQGDLAVADCKIEGPLGDEPATVRGTSPSGNVILYVHVPKPSDAGLVILDLDSTAVELVRRQAPTASLDAIKARVAPVVQALRNAAKSDALTLPITDTDEVKKQVTAVRDALGTAASPSPGPAAGK